MLCSHPTRSPAKFPCLTMVSAGVWYILDFWWWQIFFTATHVKYLEMTAQQLQMRLQTIVCNGESWELVQGHHYNGLLVGFCGYVPVTGDPWVILKKLISCHNNLRNQLHRQKVERYCDWTHDLSIVGEIQVWFFWSKCDPLVSDVVYLHKYSHSFI